MLGNDRVLFKPGQGRVGPLGQARNLLVSQYGSGAFGARAQGHTRESGAWI